MFEIIGGLIALVAGLFLKMKWDGNKIENLEEENAAHEKKDEIIDDMKLAEVKAEAEKDEAIKNIDDSDWRNSI